MLFFSWAAQLQGEPLMSEGTIASFVLRFTQEYTPGTESSCGVWRGIIRHVQSNEETRFTQMESALTFISRYVDITNSSERENEQGS